MSSRRPVGEEVIIVKSPLYYVWLLFKALLMLATVGLLIGILICICQAKKVLERLYDRMESLGPIEEGLGEVVPCLINEYCLIAK